MNRSPMVSASGAERHNAPGVGRLYADAAENLPDPSLIHDEAARAIVSLQGTP